MPDSSQSLSILDLFRSARFWRWSGPVALARMPTFMGTFAVTAAAAAFLGDADRGGTVASAFVLGLLITAGLTARAADRRGARRVVRWQLLGSALGWLILTLLIAERAPLWAWHAVALLAGACLAGSTGILRSTLSDAVGPSRLRVASSVDASMLEVAIAIAPLVVAVAALIGPLGNTLSIAAVCAIAAASLVVLPIGGAPQTSDTASTKLRLNAPLLAWSAAGFSFGVALGAAEIGAVSLSVRLGGSAQLGSLVIAVLAVASALGGLLDAMSLARDRGGHRARVLVLSLVMVVGTILIAVANSLALVFVGVAVLGICTAPLLSVRSLRTDANSEPASRARAFAFVFAAQSLGFAAAGILLSTLGPVATTACAGVLIGLSAAAAALIDAPRVSAAPSDLAADESPRL